MIQQVEGNVYRGPRPQPPYIGIRELFARVISLEGLAEDIKEQRELSPVWVLSEPITFSQIYFTGISQAKLDLIIKKIETAATWGKVLVHCEHGEDRTGLAIAAWRVRACKWTKEAAMAEALDHGYRRWLNFGLNKTWAAFQ